MGTLTYLMLNIFTISYPLARSFEHRISFIKNWPFLLPATAFVGSYFIIWDIYFTRAWVWHFNPDYVLGYYILSLPIEEWLFFLTVPFACVFIHEVLKYFFPKDYLAPYQSSITIVLMVMLFVVAFYNQDKLYTFVNFTLCGILLGMHLFKGPSKIMGRFYFTYLVALIPFFVVNGVLTALPVVEYNDAENLGIRLFTIPIEDTIYNMHLLLGVISIYEKLKAKSAQKSIKPVKEVIHESA